MSNREGRISITIVRAISLVKLQQQGGMDNWGYFRQAYFTTIKHPIDAKINTLEMLEFGKKPRFPISLQRFIELYSAAPGCNRAISALKLDGTNSEESSSKRFSEAYKFVKKSHLDIENFPANSLDSFATVHLKRTHPTKYEYQKPTGWVFETLEFPTWHFLQRPL